MGKFFIPFLVLTGAEVYLMKTVAEKLGYDVLLIFVITTGIIGINLAKKQGKQLLQKFQSEISAARMPNNPLSEGVMILVAAAVLITPGFLTDIIGFSLLIPGLRKFFAPKLASMFVNKSKKSSNFTFHSSFGNDPQQQKPFSGNDDFIDMPDEKNNDHKNISSKDS